MKHWRVFLPWRRISRPRKRRPPPSPGWVRGGAARGWVAARVEYSNQYKSPARGPYLWQPLVPRRVHKYARRDNAAHKGLTTRFFVVPLCVCVCVVSLYFFRYSVIFGCRWDVGLGAKRDAIWSLAVWMWSMSFTLLGRGRFSLNITIRLNFWFYVFYLLRIVLGVFLYFLFAEISAMILKMHHYCVWIKCILY